MHFQTGQWLLSKSSELLRQSWWIVLLFFLSIYLVYSSATGSITEIVIIFVLHFLADVLMMMVFSAYSKRDFAHGGLYLITSSSIFMGIGIYSGLAHGQWQYLIPSLVFMPVSIKNFIHYRYKKELSFINVRTALIGNLGVVYLFFFLGLVDGIQSYVQLLGFAVTSTALVIIQNWTRYIWFMIGASIISFGSFLVLFQKYFLMGVIS
ncbi:MAG: hypothetical protein U9Q15_01465 [Patescibacteria group bacterium]|nr:hypothetical protein [Patescibacteria group bacterium]